MRYSWPQPRDLRIEIWLSSVLNTGLRDASYNRLQARSLMCRPYPEVCVPELPASRSDHLV